MATSGSSGMDQWYIPSKVDWREKTHAARGLKKYEEEERSSSSWTLYRFHASRTYCIERNLNHRYSNIMSLLGRKRSKSRAKHRRNGMKHLQESFKRLKREMEEIGEEQKSIREGQSEVKEKFAAIEAEPEELKRESKFIIQQSARTQVKLALMFRMLKAREAGDFNTAASLTETLHAKRRRKRKLATRRKGKLAMIAMTIESQG